MWIYTNINGYILYKMILINVTVRMVFINERWTRPSIITMNSTNYPEVCAELMNHLNKLFNLFNKINKVFKLPTQQKWQNKSSFIS